MPPAEAISSPEGYRGDALELLRRYGAHVGQRLRVETTDGLQIAGLLIPRYEHADSEHIIFKLKSGYNIGLKSSKIKSIIVIENQSTPTSDSSTFPSPKVNGDLESYAHKKKLLLLSTGGTIASRVDYRTGAVHPALSASDLYTAIPELDELADVNPQVVFSIYSENMTPSDWSILTKRIIESRSTKEDPEGIVVMMGTDTLAYASAALSFSLIGFDRSVVFVAAQRSSDRPSSDAALNLKAAVVFAVNSKRSGVYVAMHETENDDFIAVHSGVRVRKNHTSRRDAFKSIDSPLIARVRGTEISYTPPGQFPIVDMTSGDSVALMSGFEPKVALVKFHPGFDPSILDYLIDERQVKGLIIEGTGLGHVSASTVTRIAHIFRTKNIFVGITSQCIWGHVDLNVYDTGRDLIAAGAVPLENMLAETAFAKLSWSLGNFGNTKEIMLKNFVGEFSPRIPLNQ